MSHSTIKTGGLVEEERTAKLAELIFVQSPFSITAYDAFRRAESFLAHAKQRKEHRDVRLQHS